jgi:O-antigen ligase
VPWLVALASTASLMFLASFYTGFDPSVRGLPRAHGLTSISAWAWLVAGAVSCAIALLQYFSAAGALDPWVHQALPGEAIANLRQRNQFASLSSMALAALLWLRISGRFTGHREGAAWILVCLLEIGNAASSSRTGLLQLLMLCVLAGVWGGWRLPPVRRLLLAAVVVYALAVALLPWLASLDLSTYGMFARLRAGDALCASRLTLWSNVLDLIAQKPWTGWGWGELDYAHYISLYDGPRFCEILDNAHNLPLHLAVELGIPAALLIFGGVVWWVWRQRPWRETDTARQLAWTVLAVIFLHSLLEYPLWYGPFQMAVGLCTVILWRRSHVQVREESPLSSRVNLAARIAAIGVIVGSACVAWDYHRVSQIYLTPQARDAAYRDNTLTKIKGAWFFGNQVRFAELSITPLTRDNAQWTFDTATALLHYSPEPRVIEKLIESAVLLERDDEALRHLLRYRAAFPSDYVRWVQANAELPGHLERLK